MTEPVTPTAVVEPAVNVEPVIATNPVVTSEPTIVNPVVTEAPKSWVADDWREKLAGGDAKELARLQRFTDLPSVYKSYRELEGKVSSGALKQEVDISKFDEAQINEWRKANGIPATAGEYQIDLPQGLVLGEEDQIILGNVLETMHAQGRKPAEVNQTINAFLEARELQVAAAVEQQKVNMAQAEETLRQEWHGATYLTNLSAVKNLLASAPNGLGEQIAQARLPNGNLMGSDTEALKWLAAHALELNPAGTIVPGVGADQMQSVQTEKNALEAEMKKDINAWRKNDAGRARHRELIDAELKLKTRGY